MDPSSGPSHDRPHPGPTLAEPSEPGPASRVVPITVIVPTRDTWELTLEALHSAAAATGPERELLVVDDGGQTPPPSRLAKELPQVRCLRRNHSEGFSHAVNEGLQAASGEILVLLNSDATLAPDALEVIQAAFERQPRLGIAGARLYFPDGAPQWSGGPKPTPLWLALLASDLPRRIPRRAPRGHRPAHIDWVSGAAVAIRRQVLIEVGLLDQRFGFYGQDVDLCLRARSAGWDVELVEQFVAHHHGGATIGADARKLALLWGDLVTCVRLHEGDRAARRAARALAAGAWLRRLVALVAPADPQRDRRHLSDAVRAAHRAAGAPLRSGSIPRLAQRPSG